MAKKVYRLIINQPSYLPESEPSDFTNLVDLKRYIGDLIKETKANKYTYHGWENYYRLTRADFIYAEKHGGITIGLFYEIGSTNLIADYVLSVAYVPEDL